MRNENTVIGKSIPNRDGINKVTGKATYIADIKLPAMLYAKVVSSPPRLSWNFPCLSY